MNNLLVFIFFLSMCYGSLILSVYNLYGVYYPFIVRNLFLETYHFVVIN